MGLSVAICALVIVAACRHTSGLHVQSSAQDQPPEGSQQPLETWRPYDFDDVRRDESSTQAVRSMVSVPDQPHFFSEADCSIFTSAEVCASARKHVTYLTSFPCSGNTWVRSLLEKTLLIYTGAVFRPDRQLTNAGMLGEGLTDPSRVFPVKTHWPVLGNHTEGEGVKNLAIVRAPLHSVLSFVQLEASGGHSTEVRHAKLRARFNRFARPYIAKWALMAQTYKGRNDTYVVRYEDLVANTTGVMLTQILPYLGVNANHPDVRARLDAAIGRSNNAYHTTRRKHTYSFEFTQVHKNLLKTLVHSSLLEHYGYKI